jgi:type II restriction enzyme
MKRDFDAWLSQFRASISNYGYYTDFEKVLNNVDCVQSKLERYNDLLGVEDVESMFECMIREDSTLIEVIPILVAIRTKSVFVLHDGVEYDFDFKRMNYPIEKYTEFMREMGVFDLFKSGKVKDIPTMVVGVEMGLDTNARKNRGGHLMEDLVESKLIEAGFIKDETYFKETYIEEIEQRFGVDLSCISNNSQATKRFDFVVKGKDYIYGIETNFYTGGGSKLNETARSYKTIALELKYHPRFKFVWFTDGNGWKSARKNLKETYDVLPDIYCISEMESGIIKDKLI